MKKQNLMLLTIAILLSCNCFLLWKIYKQSGREMNMPQSHPGEEGPRRGIIQQLHLDNDQIEQYEAMIRKHRAAITSIDKETIELKRALYQSLLTPVNRDSLIQLIGAQQMKIERVNLSHFEDIKTLCRPEQQVYFKELAGELERLFNHPRPPRRGPRPE